MADSSEADLKAEIARLTGAINQHKHGNGVTRPPYAGSRFNRNNTYVNPNSKAQGKLAAPEKKYPSVNTGSVQPREVVIDGVAFQSSGRSLVRKDCASSNIKRYKEEEAYVPVMTCLTVQKPASLTKVAQPLQTAALSSKPQRINRSTRRPYKPRTSRRQPLNHNMTLVNGPRSQTSNNKFAKSIKLSNKQCSRFSTTGVCQRGKTCPYKHDPSQIAICWPFLQGTCPNTAETCSLSHDPTPERTPLCVHFANNGRCKQGDACLFPHVRVGPRNGVCREFAVLGYCEIGLDCNRQHVRECPDFADSGKCPNPKCRLPHVIRANRNRPKATEPSSSSAVKSTPLMELPEVQVPSVPAPAASATEVPSTSDANLGDDYISFTFHESDLSDGNDDDDDEEEEEEESGEDDISEDDDDGLV